MIKFYFSFIFIFFFSASFSQSYPYLNASTGNENEFPIDKDTNIYMFHGSRLVKTDKNFNVIWANTYNGISFSSLLLSKTGSMYFIGAIGSLNRAFGKINPNGTLVWVKNTSNISSPSGTLAIDCECLYLDRNNNLIITGGNYGTSGHLVKTDTNGVGLKLVGFTGIYSCLGGLSTVIDSSGYYKLFGLGLKPLGGFSLGMLTYSDLTNTITNVTDNSYSSSFYNLKWKFVRSKLNGFYTWTSADLISSTFVNVVHKFSVNGYLQWGEPINLAGPYWRVYHLEADETGNAFASVSNYNSSSNHNSFVMKIDSTGNANSKGMRMLNGYYIYNVMANSYDIPAHASRVIHDNNYYFDISGFSFPGNPLTVQKFNSSFSTPCTPTLVINGGAAGLGVNPIQTPTLTVIPSFTIASYASTVSSVSFSVNSNFCTVLNVGEMDLDQIEFNIYPNPANEKIYWREEAGQVEVYDVNGKKVKTGSNTSFIDVADLLQGVYFISIKTDRGVVNKKFVKE
jgi:hypothetical protein